MYGSYVNLRAREIESSVQSCVLTLALGHLQPNSRQWEQTTQIGPRPPMETSSKTSLFLEMLQIDTST